MTAAEPARTRRPYRPAPKRDEKMGWGAWVMVGACVLLGAGLVMVFRARLARPVPAVASPAAPEAAQRAAPAGGQAEAPATGQAEGPSSPPTGGEGKVAMSPQEGLRAVWVKPQGVVPVFPHAAIEVGFSAAMDRASVQRAFEMLPEVPGAMEWPRPDQMVFRPRPPLEMGAEYRVRLGPSATDLRRQEGLQPHEWSFQVHRAYTYRHNVGRVIRHACGTCHAPGRPAARVPLGSYPEVVRYVRKGDAAASPLYAVLGDPRHAQVPADWRLMYYVIRDWINQADAAE